MRIIFVLKTLLPGFFRRGAASWDPVPPQIVDQARRRAETQR
jgi:hypothetical protein